MSSNLCSLFISREISVEKSVCTQEFKEQLLLEVSSIINELASNSEILLRDKDPFRFALIFLAAIDAGHFPVAIPTDLPDFQFDKIKMSRGNPVVLDNFKVTGGSVKASVTGCYGSLTSGTTSVPKLCVLDAVNARACAKAHADSLNIASEDQVIQSLPIYHSFGIIAYIFTTIEVGNRLNFNRAFLGIRALQKRELCDCILHLSPAQLSFVVKERSGGIKGIKSFSVGGGMASTGLLEKLSELFPATKIYTTYGLTEAGPRVTTGVWKRDRPTGYIGESISGVTLAVLKNGVVKKSGEGKLCIKTPYLKINLGADELVDDYLLTRDLVCIDECGSVNFLSREDDLINVGGISVYPKDIEDVVKEYDLITDCIVFKRKSSEYEEYPILAVEGMIEVKLLDDFLKHKLTIYQVPKEIHCFEQFSRFSLGKINRHELLSRIKHE